MHPRSRKRENARANGCVNVKVIKVTEKPMPPEEFPALLELIAAIGVELWKLKGRVNFPESRPPH